jgi:hypothetical protein
MDSPLSLFQREYSTIRKKKKTAGVARGLSVGE